MTVQDSFFLSNSGLPREREGAGVVMADGVPPAQQALAQPQVPMAATRGATIVSVDWSALRAQPAPTPPLPAPFLYRQHADVYGAQISDHLPQGVLDPSLRSQQRLGR
jgi:hypothetical protein